MDPVTEPCLIVCENVKVENIQDPDRKFLFAVRYGAAESVFQTETEDEFFAWTVRVCVPV